MGVGVGTNRMQLTPTILTLTHILNFVLHHLVLTPLQIEYVFHEIYGMAEEDMQQTHVTFIQIW